VRGSSHRSSLPTFAIAPSHDSTNYPTALRSVTATTTPPTCSLVATASPSSTGAHATRGDPAADVARTWLLLAAGALPDSAPALTRAFARIGRRFLLAGYLRAYQRQTPPATVAFTSWIPVVAAARLADDIQAERDTVLALART
jgi:hypothetical protein